MDYVGRFFSNVKYIYNEINPATLTGAIDVIVVQQDDGTYKCSPFHVRFGKMGVLRSKEKVVDIEINGEPVDLQMKLGENGEAFFVEETSSEEFLPAKLATSPIPSSAVLMAEGMKEMFSEVQLKNINKSSEKGSPSLRDMDFGTLVEGIKEPQPESCVAEEKLDEPIQITLESEHANDGLDRTPVVTAHSLGQQECASGSSIDDDLIVRNRSETKSSTLTTSDSVKMMDEENLTKKNRVRKKRRKSGRVAHLASKSFQLHEGNSESSVSRNSDDDIFKMDDFSDNEASNWIGNKTGTNYIDSDDWSRFLEEPLRTDFHPFSDNDATPIVSPHQTRPPSPKSDTEAELQREVQGEEGDKLEWNWGELPEQISDHEKDVKVDDNLGNNVNTGLINDAEKRPSKWSIMNFMRSTKRIRHSKSLEEGIYLDDLDSEGLDPEIVALYLNAEQTPLNRIRTIREVKDEDKSSDLGNSLPQSPSSVEGAPPVQDLSITNSNQDFSHFSMDDIALSLCGGLQKSDKISHDVFIQSMVNYDEFTKNPAILENPNLVVRIGGKYYPWLTAGPLMMSCLVYQRPLPEFKVESMMKEQLTKGKGGLSSWFSWSRRQSGQSIPKKTESVEDTIKIDKKPTEPVLTETQVEDVEDESEHSSCNEFFKKSIRLNTEQLACLNLKPGPNEIIYSVTTRYQGTCVCKSTIYLWQFDSKIVISDIDGTITKSDVIGQILPVLGRDWTHSGVANLYSSIADNGYDFLFLSSRAIGQAGYTKGYLKSVNQDSIRLPDGPLLLNPSSLISAFHKEVIVRKPEEFKIGCLKDICSLFPENPLYAGFGNRINDVWAYRAVGVPSTRIFTINPKGQVSQEMTKTFKSSYNKLQDLSDHVFPPLNSRKSVAFEESSNYSSFTFWRSHVVEIDPDDELLIEPGKEVKK